ncbi:hypothetical protein SEA_YOSIF_40 [Streptomyces phage Yosif]|uniref:Uncharacterized protein n=1 Tax=Streptomyces phage Yosif TaxID=2201421 RepID=A0A2Z4QBY4_9CAUD|nr:hypothetical protein KGG71_gp40 [Streptomyces phage Yosif]AWY07604.1 hypothetical protein SEA_YOSIF_40 [Streptomyces phage Yosif]
MNLDEFFAFLDYLADPESDPALIMTMEEHLGVTHGDPVA